ncbi:hypothetical protein HDU92_002475 [Lobulomyces angularis]|nr:hypothetical protein HDU92_002475 [Lobulomyces angularis]
MRLKFACSLLLLANAVVCTMVLKTWDSATQSKYTVPTYKATTQQNVAGIVANMMQIYCNGPTKMSQYSISSPLASAYNILNGQSSLTSPQFQSAQMMFILSLRDFHTSFVLPTPASCFTWIYPIALDLINSNDLLNNPVVVVKSTRYYQKEYIPSGFSINKGDIVVSINGFTPAKLFQKFAAAGGGANNYGGMRAVLSLFDTRSGAMYGPPSGTFVQYVLQRPDNSQYSYTGVVTAYYSDTCVDSAPTTASEDIENPIDTESLDPYRAEKIGARVEYEMSPPFANLNYQTTQDSTLSYTIYQSGTSKIGIIKISSFIPETTTNGQQTILNLVYSLLTNQLKDTEALVIDVRNNGGGLVSLADTLPQLFGGINVQPMRFRALVNEINGVLLNNWADWKTAYQNAKSKGLQYTSDLLSFTTYKDANNLGNYYSKPVGVWMNAKCYSACDMFVANMKDNGVARIYGEDPQTGAGGANVVDLSFLSYYAPTYFKNNLPGGQTMRLAWRQAVRKNGALIEDLGVSADMVVRPTQKDFIDTNSNSALDKIIADLKSRNNMGVAGISFSPNIPLTARSIQGEHFSFRGDIQNIKTIHLSARSENIAEFSFKDHQQFTNFLIADPQPSTQLGLREYEINGYDESGNLRLRQVRLHETIPPLSNFKKILFGAATELDFNSESYKSICTKGDKETVLAGWNVLDNVLQLGDGTHKYPNNLNTKFKAFIKIENYMGKKLIIKQLGAFEIEEGDHFSLNVKYITGKNGSFKDKILLKNYSGKGLLEDVTVQDLESEYLELSWEFKSNHLDLGEKINGPHLLSVSFSLINN